ncbi:MAG: MFS transporter [Myxococcota bacterium]
MTLSGARQVGAQRIALITTTAIAVVSDAVLVPFYPQLFESAFGVDEPSHVGIYLAATCLTVMFMLPLWAELGRRIPTLALLAVAQAGAGTLSLVCFASTDLAQFWIISLTMIVFKASYLLVYPYLMRLTDETNHVQTIGLLTVIVHLGAILGAVIGGWILSVSSPRHGFIAMAIGDFAQMAVCMYLLARGARGPQDSSEDSGRFMESLRDGRWVQVAKLASVMFALYLSAFVLRPFFVQYWTMRSLSDSELIAGLVFSIPAWMSLACLFYQRRNPTPPPILRSFALCTLGLLLQCVPSVPLLVLGLALFGWSLFRAMVHLDALIFETSPPELYATAFSQMHFFQQLGALVGFYVAGSAVAQHGLVAPFAVAAGGFVVTAVLFHRFFTRAPVAEEAVAT